MVIDNSNYKILYDRILVYGDYIRFEYKQKRYDYLVQNMILCSVDSLRNDAIFKALYLYKYDIATKMYGYTTTQGDWPVFNSEDYKAATKLVIFLFEEIERREHPESFTKIKTEPKINTKVKIKIKVDSNIKITLKN